MEGCWSWFWFDRPCLDFAPCASTLRWYRLQVGSRVENPRDIPETRPVVSIEVFRGGQKHTTHERKQQRGSSFQSIDSITSGVTRTRLLQRAEHVYPYILANKGGQWWRVKYEDLGQTVWKTFIAGLAGIRSNLGISEGQQKQGWSLSFYESTQCTSYRESKWSWKLF